MANYPKRRSIRPTPKVKPKSAPNDMQRANRAKSKLDQVIGAPRAPKGATITTLMKLIGWQMHSVRGAIAGALA